MKFYIPNDKIYLLDDQEVEWLVPVDLQLAWKRLRLTNCGNGYMFEADDSIQTFVKILSGLEIPEVTNQEYNQLLLDKIAYLGKERTKRMRQCWISFYPDLINS